MLKKFIAAMSVTGVMAATPHIAHAYPFNLPSNISVTIDVNTSSQEVYNNQLLGTNVFGYRTTKERELMGKFDPITVRFPHGLWANWYDWETDGTRVFGDDSFKYIHSDGSLMTTQLDHLANIKTFDNNNIKVGIDGLTELNASKKNRDNKGYDMLWTFNMSADGANFNNGSPATVARYKDLKARGFDVTDIELGNENFYPGQRSSIIPNAEEYIKRAKSMSRALKARDANIQVSVPLLRRGSWANKDWNKDLTQDQSYYDAVTVHTYVGSDPDNAANSDNEFGTVLTARKHLASSVNDYARKVAPTKPIWLTEWGVNAGGANAASVLGMADSYIYMSENQNIFDRANWFSANGKLNSFVIWEDYKANSGATRSRIKYPLQKTAFGSSYEIIRSVFENSTMLKSTNNSPHLTGGVDAVSARVVVKDGKTLVFAVNLTDKVVPFNVKLNGATFLGYFDHKAMSFNALSSTKVMGIDANPLKDVDAGSGTIRLPKYSMSVIHLKDAAVEQPVLDVALTAPSHNATFTLGDTIQLAANVSGKDVSQVNFRIDTVYLSQDRAAPYVATWTPEAAGTYSIDTVAITADGKRAVSASHTITITKKNEPAGAYVHLTKANATDFALDGGTGASDGQNVKLWSTNLNNTNQHWVEVDRNYNYFSYQKRGTDYCLDAGNGGANGQQLTLVLCDESSRNQQFKKESKGGDTFQLRKRYSMDYAIDGGNGGEKGQNVKLWNIGGGDNANQQWIFTTVQ